MFVRVGEDNRAADGQVVNRGDPLHRRLAIALPVPVLDADPHLPSVNAALVSTRNFMKSRRST